MKAIILATLCLVAVSTASAFQPRTGHWWNPAESGRGFNMDIQDGVLVLTVYAYDGAGNAQWYLASGAMTNSQHNFAGTLDKYRNGQCVSCNYAGSPTLVGNDGTVTIAFASETSATITLPGGHTTVLQPFNFGFGDPPQGLLGEWVFVWDNGTTFAIKYNLVTVVANATPNGNGAASGIGVVGDSSRITFCELQTSGTLAGQVICGDGDAAGNVKNAFAFRFGLDETFSGFWVLPPSNTLYPMKGFKIKSKSGFTRAASTAPSIAPMANSTPAQVALPGIMGSPDSAMLERAQAILNVVRQGSDLR